MEEYCVMCGEMIPEGTHVCVHCGELKESDQQIPAEMEKMIPILATEIKDLPISGAIKMCRNVVKHYFERYDVKMQQK